MDTDQLLDKLTNAVSFRFKEDKTSPGITVSKLKTGYYCSVVRYDGAFAKNKKVLCTARSEKLSDALRTLASSFLSMDPPTKDPIQDLAAFING